MKCRGDSWHSGHTVKRKRRNPLKTSNRSQRYLKISKLYFLAKLYYSRAYATVLLDLRPPPSSSVRLCTVAKRCDLEQKLLLTAYSSLIWEIASPAVFTARCTLMQSAVLRSHVICLSVCMSVCLSVTLVNCDHIGWNSSNIISPLVSLGCSLFATPTWWVCSKRNTPKFGPKVIHPLLIWASETFDRKLRPNSTDSATVTMESESL